MQCAPPNNHTAKSLSALAMTVFASLLAWRDDEGAHIARHRRPPIDRQRRLWHRLGRRRLLQVPWSGGPVTGKERSLYSLRYYYATQRVLEGIPVHDLSEQMANSNIMSLVEMGTGLSIALVAQNAGLTDDFERRLKAQHRQPN